MESNFQQLKHQMNQQNNQQLKQPRIPMQLNPILITDSVDQLTQSHKFATLTEYNSDVRVASITARFDRSMQCHGNCASESADSKGYSADFFESCSSIGEVGHFLCCGGVCADATAFSSPSPRFIRMTSPLNTPSGRSVQSSLTA